MYKYNRKSDNMYVYVNQYTSHISCRNFRRFCR